MARFLLCIILILLSSKAVAQCQGLLDLFIRTNIPSAGKDFHRPSGSFVYSRIFYGLPEWNCTGAGYLLKQEKRVSGGAFCRNGIRGYSSYRLSLAHSRDFGYISADASLHVAMIKSFNRPLQFRLSGDFKIESELTERTEIGLIIYDWPAWLTDAQVILDPVPTLRFMLNHQPGRQISWLSYLDISPLGLGSIGSQVQFILTNAFHFSFGLCLSRPGFSWSVHWITSRFRVNFQFEYLNPMGVTPTLILQNR